MKLREALKLHAGEKVKIGALSSFIFCGTAEGAMEVLKKLSSARKKELISLLESTKNRNANFERIWIAKSEKSMEQAARNAKTMKWTEAKKMQMMQKAVESCDKSKEAERRRIKKLLETLPEQIEHFKGYEERKVLEVYPSLFGGTIILFEGTEVGAHWDYDEVEGGNDDKRIILRKEK